VRNRYRIGELIGSGGMSSVYRAHDEFLGRDVALKVFRASADAEEIFRAQEDEINTLARLNHPYLVTLLDAAVDRSADHTRIFYAMELVEGTDLRRRLEGGPLSPRLVAQLGYHVASALEHVHSHEVVHRDIKPANVLLHGDDQTRVTAKLGDFGIASRGSGLPLTDGEPISGTVAYLSPEQARGDLVTMASDVYSLGLVLVECFTRRLAFPGQPQESVAARLALSPDLGDVPDEWIPLLRAMTEREPEDRPTTRDVALALRDAFQAETGRHRAGRPEGGLAAG
jgi:serine/threonine protein kinase